MKWAKMAVSTLTEAVSFSISSDCKRCFSTVGKEWSSSVAHLLLHAHISALSPVVGLPEYTTVNVFYDEINRYVYE